MLCVEASKQQGQPWGADTSVSTTLFLPPFGGHLQETGKGDGGLLSASSHRAPQKSKESYFTISSKAKGGPFAAEKRQIYMHPDRRERQGSFYIMVA